MLTELTKRIAEHYEADPSTPSVVLAWINQNCWYASIVRYKEKLGKDKFVVCKARHDDFDTCIESLTNQWYVIAGLTNAN